MNHSSHALNARKIAGFTIKLGTTPHWFIALDDKNEDTTFGHFDPFRDEYFFYCLIIYDVFHFQGNSSGTTAICTFIRGKTLYAAWLGDSQAVLVRNGQAVKIVEPHKPNRPVSSLQYY